MYAIKLAWKEFSLNLQDIDTWVKTNAGTNYQGNSADVELTLWYSEAPDQETQDAIEAYWDALDEDSDEAVNYVSASDVADAINALRPGIPANTWDAMSIAERKIVLGQTPTKTELGL